jgi:hypothetical protein
MTNNPDKIGKLIDNSIAKKTRFTLYLHGNGIAKQGVYARGTAGGYRHHSDHGSCFGPLHQRPPVGGRFHQSDR